jgi:RNA polymerase sigma-70 factor (ECF subfamily)
MNGSDSEFLKDIVEKAKAGDSEAFSYLYKTYVTPLYRYIYFRVGGKAEAEDLTQDVFVKAYTSFGSYTYIGTSPLAYFYTIARNAVIDYRRKKKFLITDEEDALLEVADTSDSPEEEAIKSEFAQEIRLHIAELSEDQQDVITLRFIESLSTKEVSEILGKSEESVRQLQSRSLRALKISYLKKNLTH